MLIQKTKLRNLSKKFLRGYLQETFWCTVNWFGKKKMIMTTTTTTKLIVIILMITKIIIITQEFLSEPEKNK